MLETNFNEAYARLEHNIPKSKSEEVKRLISNADDGAYHKIMQMRLESKNIFKSHSGLAVFVCGLIGSLFMLLNILIYGWLTPYTVNKIQYASYVSIGLKNISTEYENLNKYFLFEITDYENFKAESENYNKIAEEYKSGKKTHDAKVEEYTEAKAAAEKEGKDPATEEKCVKLAKSITDLEAKLAELATQAKSVNDKIFAMAQMATDAIKMHVNVLEYMDGQYARFTKMRYGRYINDANNDNDEKPAYSLKVFDDKKINGVSLNDFTFKPLIEMTENLTAPIYVEFNVETSDPVAKYFKPVEDVINENLSVISQINAHSMGLDEECSAKCFVLKVLGLALLVFDVIALIVVAVYFGWTFLYTSMEAQEINYRNLKEMLS